MFSLVSMITLCCASMISFIPSSKSPPSPRIESFMDYLPTRNSLIIFGGLNDEVSSNDLWSFSLTTLTWERLLITSKSIPASRSGCGGFTTSSPEKLFIFGGLTASGLENDLWSFDFEDMRWEKVETISTPASRSAFGFTSYTENGFLYFVVKVKRLNVTCLTWELLPPNGERPQASGSPVIEYYNGQILQATGIPSGSSPCLPFLYSYSLTSLKWTVISDRKSSFKCRGLAQSFIHLDRFFVFSGWDYQYNEALTDILIINLTSHNKSWENQKIPSKLAIDSFSSVKISEFLLNFGGFSHFLQTYTNAIDKINLKTYESVTISKHYLMPKARTMHSMTVVNSFIYLFGGMDSDLIFNDLWRFNLDSFEWSPVLPKGQVPSPRYLHASAAEGYSIFVWGGQDFEELRNDLFIFNTLTGFWTLIVPGSTQGPRPAKGSCLVVKDLKVMIFGGKTDSGMSNELWEFDIGLSKYKLLSTGPRRLSYPHCWMDSFQFFISLGSDENQQPSPNIDIFNLSSNTWHIFHSHHLTHFDSAQSCQVFLNNTLISIGGQAWQETTKQKITIFTSGKSTKILNFDLNIYAASFVYFNKSLFCFGGGSSLGSLMFPKTASGLFLQISIDKVCEKAGCKALCSPGTRNFNGRCQACPEGTFSERPGEKCEDCEMGSFSEFNASSSVYQCLPCGNSENNAKKCENCKREKFCSGFKEKGLENSDFSLKSAQPNLYESPEMDEEVIIYRVLVSVPIILVFFLFFLWKKLRSKLRNFDIFESDHYCELNSYILQKKNKTGAFFSFLFIIATLLLTSSSVFTLIKGNIEEIKGLVPLAILESEVSSFNSQELSISLIFYSYRGECSKNSKCLNTTKVLFLHISCENLEISCELLQNNCHLLITCNDGEIFQGGEVSISLTETRSFSSSIEARISSSSSVPNEESAVTASVSALNDSVFIGAEPTQFYFWATPSFFRSQTRRWKNKQTGFHLSEKKTSQSGSQVNVENLSSASYLHVIVRVEVSDTALVTERRIRQELIVFFGTVLGTASGILAVFGWVLGIFEQLVIWVRSRNRFYCESIDRRQNYIVTRYSAENND